MKRLVLLAISTTQPLFTEAQIMGNLPHPALMFASFAKEIAICEAAQSVFKGETAKYLHEIDRAAPGYLEPSELDKLAQDLVKGAATRDLSNATESACLERVFPIAKKAVEAMPCYATQDWKTCPPIR